MANGRTAEEEGQPQKAPRAEGMGRLQSFGCLSDWEILEALMVGV